MVEIRIRCGEFYDFNLIKSITDMIDGTIEIVGNFKPSGRYHSIRIWKNSISNFEEIESIYDIKESPYFCLECKKTHYSGNTYEDHKKFRGKKEDLIPCDRIIKADLTKLRNIGKRQINRLLHKMNLNPDKSDLYRYEINKLILYEGISDEKIWL